MQLKKQEKRRCKKCQKTFTTKMAVRQCPKCQTKFAQKRILAPKKKDVRSTSRPKKVKEKSFKKLVKELDAVLSLFIRKIYADDRGYVECVTCHKVKPIAEMQNGHYISRSNMWLRFDERNCHPQCVGCNVFLHGNYPKYTEYLLNRYGLKWFQNLIREGELTKKWTCPDLEKLISYYKEKLKQM